MKYQITDQPKLFKPNQGTITVNITDDDGTFEISESFKYTCKETRQSAQKQAMAFYKNYSELPYALFSKGKILKKYPKTPTQSYYRHEIFIK